MFCLVLGGLLLLKLGTVGRFIGMCLVALGMYRGYRFARTLMQPPGTIIVSPGNVDLPLGLCHGNSVRVDISEIGHVFFLRRAVPWTSAGPILIVEVGETAYMYPRNWFLTEGDQHRIAQAIREFVRKRAASGESA